MKSPRATSWKSPGAKAPRSKSPGWKSGRAERASAESLSAFGQKQNSRPPIWAPTSIFYASNLELKSIPPFFIHQLGRSRWTIDAQAFQTITTDCQLKQPWVHQTWALIVLTMIRVLAYTLTMIFYYRQVRSHYRGAPPGFCDLARQLAYWFLTAPFDSS